jgi:branched-chain amino acid transport system permease protein
MKTWPPIAMTVALCAVLVVLVALPQFANRYAVSLASAILSYVILATAWAMFSGPTRYVSLATAAFFGIGAYVTAGLATSIPLPLVVLIAGTAGFLVASVVGLSTLRLSGVYFVIFTFGLSELIRQLTTWFQINVTKTRVSYIFIKLGDNELYYYLVGLFAILLLTCAIVQRSRLGFALRVIGEDETVANHAGINTTLAKVSMFAVSSVFMSMTGAIMAPRWTYIDPNIAFNPLVSFQVVIMALLGGIGPLYGPALGTVPLVLLSEYLAGRFPYHFSIALGVCFVVIVYLLPQGLAGLAERLVTSLALRSHRRAVDQ